MTERTAPVNMTVAIHIGDCRDVLRTLPDGSVHCVVTSPPYWGLRDYGVAGQLGLEPDFRAYVAVMVGVFREVRRVLRKDGTLWLNLGDSYAGGTYSSPRITGQQGGTENVVSDLGSDGAPQLFRPGNPAKNGGNSNRDGLGRVNGLKPKDLCGIPWRVAFALQADGWYLRQDIIWSKPNPMPESVTDRCTKSHEYLFLLSKSERYFYDANAIKEPGIEPSGRERAAGQNEPMRHGLDGARLSGVTCMGTNATRNKRSVWEIATAPFSEAHFATFPPALIEPCVKAGCPIGGTVLDPFAGAGTTGLVADRLQRSAILIELNRDYSAMSERRIVGDAPLFADVRVQT